MSDPNMHWNGQQWLRWDGRVWSPLALAPVQVSTPLVAQHAYQRPGRIVTDKRNKSVQAVIAWLLTLMTLGYFLPWAIAATRGRSNAGAVGLINFLLGWTFVGWVVALVMACEAHQAGVVSAR